MTKKQLFTKAKIEMVADILGIDPAWAVAVAIVESSLGLHQKSPTGARGVFQMTSIAMKDLLWEMENNNDDLVDIFCGVLFLQLLLNRHGSVEAATRKFCDPNDRHFYVPKVMDLINEHDRLD